MTSISTRLIILVLIAIALAAIATPLLMRFVGTNKKSSASDSTAAQEASSSSPRTSTRSTAATVPPNTLVNLTRAADLIVGICNTVALENVGGIAASYPNTESPSNAIDGNITTKYLNFGDGYSGCGGSSPSGLNTGFLIIPFISNATRVLGVQFGTADDSPERDPITITLEGSNQTDYTRITLGTSWTLIYSGSTGIDSNVDPGRKVYIAPQMFSNTMRFSSYRLLITSKRDVGSAVQYSEAQLLGYV